MVLNYIWITFFLAGFIVALYRLLFMGDTEIFSQVMQGIFSDAKNGFEISIGLTGVLALWLGFMKIGEKGGIITVLAKLIAPFFRLFARKAASHRHLRRPTHGCHPHGRLK